MKTLESITVSGVIAGKIWMPACYCWKDFNVKFTPDDRPFTRVWEGLPDALNHIVNDGDFQSCGVVDVHLAVAWRDGKDVITRYSELNLEAKAISDFKATPEVCDAYFHSSFED